MYIIVVGATIIGKRLIAGLVENKHDVVLIDRNKIKCQEIYAETGAISITGDATNLRVLEKAGIKKADVFVTCLDSDSENLALCLLAKKYGVPRIISKLEDPEYRDVFRLVGIHGLVGYTDILYHNLMIEIENPRVKRLTTLAGGRGELVMIRIPEDSPHAGKRISSITGEADFPEDVLFVAIIRGEKLIIPRGNTRLEAGDDIILMTQAQDMAKLDFLMETY